MRLIARRSRGTVVVAGACALGLTLLACSDRRADERQPVPGGTFRIVVADTGGMDPAHIDSRLGLMLARVTMRTLVAYAPLPGEAGVKLVADLATDLPTVSADSRTYTFTLRPSVRYEPNAAKGRAITSADIRYGIERSFYASVAGSTATQYFRDLFEGDEDFVANPAPDHHIAGIDVSDPNKIVFHLKRATGDFLHRLALPAAAPVPLEYARPFDAARASTYGDAFAATGPYRLEKRGKAGDVLALVRNESWVAKDDPVRKAYPDRFEVVSQYRSGAQAAQSILDGDADYNGDLDLPLDTQRKILDSPQTKRQLSLHSTDCMQYVVLNTTIPPFDKLLVRQAVQLVLDKRAMRQARGGDRAGSIATHVLLPGLPGFRDVGQRDFNPYPSANFSGDVEAAKERMRLAGFESGMYEGKPLPLIASEGQVSQAVADVVATSLLKIGIRTARQTVKPEAVYARLSVARSGIAVGSSVRWCWDYPDASTVLAPMFDGRSLGATGLTNYSQVNDDQLNRILDKALAATGTARASLWAEADRRAMHLGAVVPWLWEASAHLVSKRVAGVQFTVASSTIDLAVVWIDQRA